MEFKFKIGSSLNCIDFVNVHNIRVPCIAEEVREEA